MTTYDLKDSELESLKGKTLLITGASTGIGRDTVKLAHSVYLPDYNDEKSANKSFRVWRSHRSRRLERCRGPKTRRRARRVSYAPEFQFRGLN